MRTSTARFLLGALALVLAAVAMFTLLLSEPARPALPIVHLENIFIDVDGDGDRDYVLSLDYVADDDYSQAPAPPADSVIPTIPEPSPEPGLDPTPSPRSW